MTQESNLSAIEHLIIRRAAADLIADGFKIDVSVYRDVVLLADSSDADAILTAIDTSETEASEYYLIPIRANPEGHADRFLCGWVQLHHGAETGVIADFSVNIETHLTKAQALAATYEDVTKADPMPLLLTLEFVLDMIECGRGHTIDTAKVRDVINAAKKGGRE